MPSVIGSSSGSSAKLAINANSLISFNASNQAAQTIWWVSIGKQQWGYSAFIYGGKKVTFPIPYAVQCYGVVSQNIQTTTNFIVCAINDVDITGFWDSNGSVLGIYWFAYGKQQWGTFGNGQNTFPLAFLNFACMAVAGERTENSIITVSKTGFTAVIGYNNSAKTYLAAGC